MIENQLPEMQTAPLPDLGSHWDVFEKLAAQCQPKMSFLEDQYQDPATWTEQARRLFLDSLHYSPPPCSPNPEVVERVDLGTHIRERVLISTTPNIRIPVYVLLPKNLSEPAPALVALHDHGGFYFWGKEKLVHLPPEHPALVRFKTKNYGSLSLADELAKRGYVVIVSDMLHWGERGMYLDADPERVKQRDIPAITEDDIKQFHDRSWAHEELVGRTALTCGVTWPGIIIWDDLRVTDYLAGRPEVDASRIGCFGLSVGSTRAVFLGALSPHVRASVAVCWMASYPPMARNHVRYGVGYTKLIPGLYGNLDWPDLAGLHWPGHLMTINGLKDALYPLEAAQSATEKVKRIFEKMGSPEHYQAEYFDGPHEFNIEMQEKAFDWLGERLG